MTQQTAFIFSVLKKFEGAGICKGYIPRHRGTILGNSGVSIASGVDLGQQSKEGLLLMGVPASIVGQLQPYLGLKLEEAAQKLATLPLSLSPDAVEALDNALISAYIANVQKSFDAQAAKYRQNIHKNYSGIGDFLERPKEVQAVCVSLAYQLGLRGFPRTFTYLILGEYEKAISELENSSAWNGQYMNRRRGEAAILRQIKD